MAVELGDQFKDVMGQGQCWVVQRILSVPGMGPHAIVAQTTDKNSTRTFSLSALEDRNFFQPVKKAASAAAPAPKTGAWRGLLRFARKAG